MTCKLSSCKNARSMRITTRVEEHNALRKNDDDQPGLKITRIVVSSPEIPFDEDEVKEAYSVVTASKEYDPSRDTTSSYGILN